MLSRPAPPRSARRAAQMACQVRQAMQEQPISPWQLETGRLHRLHIAACLTLSPDEPACCCSFALHCQGPLKQLPHTVQQESCR